jgi:hypothetical protein
MNTVTKLNFSEFVDLILATLYGLEKEHGDHFFDVVEINRRLKEPAAQHWVFDAGKILESRGLARCIFELGGVCRAQLTGEGRLFVEERAKQDGIIKEYRQEPQNFVIVSGSGNQVVVGAAGNAHQEMTIEKERQPAFTLVEEIQSRLEKDRSISRPDLKDLLDDPETIRRQLKKREANRPALAAL